MNHCAVLCTLTASQALCEIDMLDHKNCTMTPIFLTFTCTVQTSYVHGHTYTKQNHFSQQIGLVLFSPQTLCPLPERRHKNHKQHLNNFPQKPHQCFHPCSLTEPHLLPTCTAVCECHLFTNKTSSYMTGQLGFIDRCASQSFH